MAKHKFNEDCESCLRDQKRDRMYRGGRAKFMTRASGYVMARKPRSAPFVIPEKEWQSLPFVG